MHIVQNAIVITAVFLSNPRNPNDIHEETRTQRDRNSNDYLCSREYVESCAKWRFDKLCAISLLKNLYAMLKKFCWVISLRLEMHSDVLWLSGDHPMDGTTTRDRPTVVACFLLLLCRPSNVLKVFLFLSIRYPSPTSIFDLFNPCTTAATANALTWLWHISRGDVAKKREEEENRTRPFCGKMSGGKRKKSLIQHTPFLLQSGFLTSVSASTEKMEIFWLFFASLTLTWHGMLPKVLFPKKSSSYLDCIKGQAHNNGKWLCADGVYGKLTVAQIGNFDLILKTHGNAFL